jgi:hypothetical protein
MQFCIDIAFILDFLGGNAEYALELQQVDRLLLYFYFLNKKVTLNHVRE